MKKAFFMLLIGSFLGIATINAQIQTPSPSPAATVKQKVGLTDVTVEYSRPSAKGRKIFGGDGLVPFGSLWRTGANTATMIDFSSDIMVGGKELKKGAYAIIAKPGAAAWDINFYKYEGGNWGTYSTLTPAATVTSTVTHLTKNVETFEISFGDLGSNSATLNFEWEKTAVSVKLETNVEKVVMANIEKVMAGPSLDDYYNAAAYYHDSGKDLKQALAWIQKANKTENPRYWQLRKESLILADLGMKKEAIAVAKQSLELSKAGGNNDYVRLNEKSIAEWSK
ncbi:MAG TPA: DUF2911 domain-containing protein [Saprospiraceae bacterium]|nr:DUF2911 domain-containing protein [Saprospiraceae bacterium]HPN71493.1 DUF2911 domain-containing protein [Saprospiraceae bacterium]